MAARRDTLAFRQDGPRVGPQYEEDSFLQQILKRLVPQETLSKFEPDLKRFGERVVRDVLEWGFEAEKNKPYLVQYDSWGNRVDQLITTPGWKNLHRVAAEEGLIAIGYQRKFGPFSRLCQFTKLYLFSSSSGLYSCPLAMTDGAARFLELLLQQQAKEGAVPLSEAQLSELKLAYERLTSTQPDLFWSSGQWMTERGGGSDVAGGTATTAVPQPDGYYQLHGFKWFTSATDANMSLALARMVDQQQKPIPGTRGLGCFFVRVRNDAGQLNRIEAARLKDKLGTRQLPTAELFLNGTRATLVSPPGRGVAHIATLVNITRIHNSVAACSFMRRIVALARDYCHRREAFGLKLSQQPLHLETLAEMEVQTRACLLLTFDLIHRMGRVEAGAPQPHDGAVLRLLTPLVKMYTAKVGVAVVSEGLECFGGAGYCEDTNLPAILRDAQVLPIWEGTTNVLSFDVLRVFANSQGKVWQPYEQVVRDRLQAAKNISALAPAVSLVEDALKCLKSYLHGTVMPALAKKSANTPITETNARAMAFSLTLIYATSLFIEHGVWSGLEGDHAVAVRFASHTPLVPARLLSGDASRVSLNRQLALDLDQQGRPRGMGNVTPSGFIRSKY